MVQKIKFLASVIVINIIMNMDLMAQSLYFSTPKESVKIISKLLIDEDWEKLSNYYYLGNSDNETIDSIKNGSYFIRDKRPETNHPGINWKYKKPFPPNFEYSSEIEAGEDTIKVNVRIEIDQGNSMIQQGFASFYLFRTSNGYQLLP